MTTNTTEDKGSAFEWWMIANIAIGAGFSAFVALLIPPYVSEATGNAAAAGIVMAIISLAAVLGPVLGGLADKYRAHRLIMNLGVLGMAVAFAMYALSAETNSLFAIDAIVMGASIAAVSAVAPVFVVGARLPKKLEAKRLTTYNLVAPVGQVLGGMMLGVVATAGWSYTQRFWLAAAVMLVAFVVTWLTSKKPAERIALAMDADAIEAEVRAEVEETVKARNTGIKGVLFSAFGAYLLVLVLSSVANNGINNQIANIMPNVYGIDEATTSALISLAGLLNIGFFLLAGWWMGRSSSLMLITTGHLLRLVGALGMAVLGMMTDSPVADWWRLHADGLSRRAFRALGPTGDGRPLRHHCRGRGQRLGHRRLGHRLLPGQHHRRFPGRFDRLQRHQLDGCHLRRTGRAGALLHRLAGRTEKAG